MQPSSFKAMNIKIAKFDDAEMAKLSTADQKTYIASDSNYSSIFMKPSLSPMNSWTMAFVTGHKYRIYWDIGQLDYSNMDIEVSPNW